MAQTTARKAPAVDEALVRIVEELAERVQRLEVAVGQVAAQLQGVGGSERVATTMPELGELLRRHEVSGRHPQWNAS
jgi:hypothetical protein